MDIYNMVTIFWSGRRWTYVVWKL